MADTRKQWHLNNTYRSIMQERDNWQWQFDAASELIIELRAEIERLRAIERYAEHRDGCEQPYTIYPVCSCGLSDLFRLAVAERQIADSGGDRLQTLHRSPFTVSTEEARRG